MGYTGVEHGASRIIAMGAKVVQSNQDVPELELWGVKTGQQVFHDIWSMSKFGLDEQPLTAFDIVNNQIPLYKHVAGIIK